MILLIVAGVCLVLAQLIGIYALRSRKADLVFSLCMVGLLALAILFGVFGAVHELS